MAVNNNKNDHEDDFQEKSRQLKNKKQRMKQLAARVRVCQ